MSVDWTVWGPMLLYRGACKVIAEARFYDFMTDDVVAVPAKAVRFFGDFSTACRERI